MIGVVIPAHNESAVIEQTLRTLLADAPPDTLDVLVVCNGCKDNTAEVAARVPNVRVIDSPVPSKVKAVNLGLREVRGDTVVCIDADIRLPGSAVVKLAQALDQPGILAAAPAVQMDLAPGTSPLVRAYYKIWLWLPYVAEGMVGCGVYALNRAGRARLGDIPDVIADDGFVRSSFTSEERAKVPDAIAIVRAPRALADLVKIKTRSRLGGYQLRRKFPAGLPGWNRPQQHRNAQWELLRTPRLWPCIPIYLYVNLLARLRAKGQLRRMDGYVWERDESSRQIRGVSG